MPQNKLCIWTGREPRSGCTSPLSPQFSSSSVSMSPCTHVGFGPLKPHHSYGYMPEVNPKPDPLSCLFCSVKNHLECTISTYPIQTSLKRNASHILPSTQLSVFHVSLQCPDTEINGIMFFSYIGLWNIDLILHVLRRATLLKFHMLLYSISQWPRNQMPWEYVRTGPACTEILHVNTPKICGIWRLLSQ